MFVILIMLFFRWPFLLHKGVGVIICHRKASFPYDTGTLLRLCPSNMGVLLVHESEIAVTLL